MMVDLVDDDDDDEDELLDGYGYEINVDDSDPVSIRQ